MDTATIAGQVLLTVLFTVSGVMKLVVPYAKFKEMPFQGWSEDFQGSQIRAIGTAEVLAAVAMVLSILVSSLSHLAGVTAVGMALIMAGAATTHFRRSEYQNIVGNVLWLGLALLVAYQTLIESS